MGAGAGPGGALGEEFGSGTAVSGTNVGLFATCGGAGAGWGLSVAPGRADSGLLAWFFGASVGVLSFRGGLVGAIPRWRGTNTGEAAADGSGVPIG